MPVEMLPAAPVVPAEPELAAEPAPVVPAVPAPVVPAVPLPSDSPGAQPDATSPCAPAATRVARIKRFTPVLQARLVILVSREAYNRCNNSEGEVITGKSQRGGARQRGRARNAPVGQQSQ